MVTDIFVKGAIEGWKISVTSTIPNVMMAFIIIKILQHSGLLSWLGHIFAPLMGLFGLPGESAAVLIGAWMSIGGGVGVAASLYSDHLISGMDIAVLTPAIFLMGSQIQYMGRCLGVIGVKGRDLSLIMIVPILSAFLGMFLMKLIVL